MCADKRPDESVGFFVLVRKNYITRPSLCRSIKTRGSISLDNFRVVLILLYVNILEDYGVINKTIHMMDNFAERHRRALWYLIYACGLLIIIAAIYSFCITPFSSDLRVFMAASSQSKYQISTGVLAAIESWELKGIANRLLMFFIYSISNLLAGFNNKIAFQIVCKAIYALGTIAIIAVTVSLVKKKFGFGTKTGFLCFIAICMTVFSCSPGTHLQAEMTAYILLLLATAFLLHGNNLFSIAAGFVLATLFFFKSIFVLLSICAFIFAFFIKKRLNHSGFLRPGIISYLCSLTGLLLIVFLVYPQEFTDMADAARFQNTLLSFNSNRSLISIISGFEDGLIKSITMIPAIIAGVSMAVISSVRYVKRKEWQELLLLLIIWMFPIMIIVLSNLYVEYHYINLLFPSCSTGIIFILDSNFKSGGPVKKVYSYSFLIFAALAFFVFCIFLVKPWEFLNYSTYRMAFYSILVMSVFSVLLSHHRAMRMIAITSVLSMMLFTWGYVQSFAGPYYRNMVRTEKIVTQTNDAFVNSYISQINGQKILYLDAGLAAFYVDQPSYSRYFFNLPLQRWTNGDAWECQKAQYDLIMNYSGKHILYHDWMDLSKYPEIKNKIETEYRLVENTGLVSYGAPWNPFNLLDSRQTGTQISIRLYTRNE